MASVPQERDVKTFESSSDIYDVFFSYAHADMVAVAPIIAVLRQAGLEVWQDVARVPDFASITKAINDGLARSKALLAYYSKAYAASRACQWELTAAYIAAEREVHAGGDPCRRIIVVNAEEGRNHLHPAKVFDGRFKRPPPVDDVAMLQELVAAIKVHLATVSGTFREIVPIAGPQWYGWKGIGSTRFAGRIPEMWTVHSWLQAPSIPTMTGATAQPVVQLCGTGGMGKSLLAEEYALRFGTAYPGGVFWLRAFGHYEGERRSPTESEAERHRQLREIAERLGRPIDGKTPLEVEAEIGRYLAAQGKPYLWVVDDLADGLTAEAVRSWFAPNDLGRTLVTTRSLAYSGQGQQLRLSILEDEDARQLLFSRRKPQTKSEWRDAERIIASVGRHALAVDVAGAALGRRSFAELSADLEDRRRDVLEVAARLAGELPNGHEASITSTLLKSIALLNKEGRDFLRLASLVAVAPIPRRLVVETLLRVNRFEESKARDRADVGMNSAEELCLAEPAGDDVDGSTMLLVHTLVSRTVRFHDKARKRTEALRAGVVKALNETLSDVAAEMHTPGNLIHARALCMERRGDEHSDILALCVAYHDHQRGAYESAQALQLQVLLERFIKLEYLHPTTLAIMNNLATTVAAQGDFKSARGHLDQVLAITTRLLGPLDPRTLTAQHNLAHVLRKQGDFARAKELQQHVLVIRQQILGKEHRDTLTTMHELSATLVDQGDLREAHELLQQVFSIRRRVLGEEHFDTLLAMISLAKTLLRLGDVEGAWALQEHGRATSHRVHGALHPLTLEWMMTAAAIVYTKGDLPGARALQEQVIHARREVLGKEHPDTLQAMDHLGATLFAQGDLAGALSLGEEILAGRRRIFGDEHPSTLKSMSDLTKVLYDLRDFARARALEEQVVDARRRALGEEHPDTLTAMSDLATTLYKEGNLAAARKLQERVLTARRQAHGEEDPATLLAMNNLAHIYIAEGDVRRARAHLENVLSIRRRVLGSEHPETSRAAMYLTVALAEAGDRAAAEAVFARDLRWLLDKDETSLKIDQQQIRAGVQHLMMNLDTWSSKFAR